MPWPSSAWVMAPALTRLPLDRTRATFTPVTLLARLRLPPSTFRLTVPLVDSMAALTTMALLVPPTLIVRSPVAVTAPATVTVPPTVDTEAAPPVCCRRLINREPVSTSPMSPPPVLRTSSAATSISIGLSSEPMPPTA